MRITQRIAKSEIHLYIQKLKNKGFVKTSDKKTSYVYTVHFKRGEERLTLKFTNNGWLSIF